jgi:hypothetical protein
MIKMNASQFEHATRVATDTILNDPEHYLGSAPNLAQYVIVVYVEDATIRFLPSTRETVIEDLEAAGGNMCDHIAAEIRSKGPCEVPVLFMRDEGGRKRFMRTLTIQCAPVAPVGDA